MNTDPKNPTPFLEKMANFFEWFALIPSVLFGAAMVAIVGAGVVARYVMASPMPWTEEASRFLMIWMVLLGLSVVTRRRDQVPAYSSKNFEAGNRRCRAGVPDFPDLLRL